MNLLNSSSTYDTLYPKVNLSNSQGTLPASQITAGTFGSGDYTIQGNLTLKGSGNYGTKLNLGDGDFVHISEPVDDELEIKGKKINFVTSDTSSSAFTWNGNAIGGGGISTPVSVANGGTGGSTASNAVYNLLNGLNTRSASQVNSYASSTYLGGYYGSTGYKIPISSLLTYIQNNASGSGNTNTGLMQVEVIEKKLETTTTTTTWSVTFSNITPKYVSFTLNNGGGTGFSTGDIECGPSAKIGSFTITNKTVSVNASGGSYDVLLQKGNIIVIGLG